jgi:hypothetical protein
MNKDGPCPTQTCERHTNCEVCQAYHKEKGNRPYCRRKKTFWQRIAGLFK